MTRKDKIKLIELLREKKRRQLKASFYEFFKFFWDVIVTEKLKEAPYHKLICDELQVVVQKAINREKKTHDLIINVPPGSSKTVIILQMLNAWTWCLDDSIRVISASATSGLASESSEKTKDLILSDEYQVLFPVKLKKDSTGKTNYKTVNGGQRYTTSVGATVTGIHAHVKLYDDLITVQDAYSETKRIAANNFMTQTLNSRNIDDAITVTVLVMQRLDENDPTGTALKKWDNVRHIKLPAEISETVSPPEAKNLYVNGLLDPVRKPKEVLAAARKNLGSYGYAGQYDQEPAPAEGGMFKKHWFKQITRVEFEQMNAEHLKNYRPVWEFSSDTAYTKELKNDPSGILAYCAINGNLFLRRYADDYLEFPELVKWIPDFTGKYGYDSSSRIYVEPKASGKSAVQYIKKYSSHNIIEDAPPKGDKIDRARGTTAITEAGRVFILKDYESKGDEHWIDDFLAKMAVFPNGSHDEAVDCFGIAVRRNELGSGRVLAF